jgi:hypothetical protein
MTYYPDQPSPANDANAPLSSWRRGRPGADDRQTPLVFWLTMLALGCGSLLGMAWGASNVLAQKGAEKLLRVDLLLPKLKSIHWDPKAVAFHRSEPAPSTKASPKDRNTIPPPTLRSTSAPVHEVPHVVAPAGFLTLPPIVETCDEPVVYLNPCAPQRGDSPMMHNWKTLTMYSLLTAAAATLAPPPLLMAQDDAKLEKLSKDLQALTKSVQSLKNSISELEKKPIDTAAIRGVVSEELNKLATGKLAELGSEIKNVGTRVDNSQTKQQELKLLADKQEVHIEFLLKEVKNLQQKMLAANGGAVSPTSPAVDKAFMDEMRSYMRKMEENSTAMKNLAEAIAKAGPTKTQTSMSPPVNNGAAPSYGRVVFNNMYSYELLLIVNGVNYRIPAQLRTVIENVPSGTLRYEVFATGFGVLKTEATTLAAGGTLNLEALNRP